MITFARKGNLYESNKDLLLGPGVIPPPQIPQAFPPPFHLLLPLLFPDSKEEKCSFLPSPWAFLKSCPLQGNRTKLSKTKLLLAINHDFYWNVDLLFYLFPFQMSMMLFLQSLVLSLELSQSFSLLVRSHMGMQTHARAHSHTHTQTHTLHFPLTTATLNQSSAGPIGAEQWGDEENHTNTLMLETWKESRIHWHLPREK